jgi:NADPH:quinone reductase-like Zn-dependent oxidoreductase
VYALKKSVVSTKAAILEKPGLENLQIKHNVEEPKLADHDVLIEVKMRGVNPIDHMVVSGVIPHQLGQTCSQSFLASSSFSI